MCYLFFCLIFVLPMNRLKNNRVPSLLSTRLRIVIKNNLKSIIGLFKQLDYYTFLADSPLRVAALALENSNPFPALRNFTTTNYMDHQVTTTYPIHTVKTESSLAINTIPFGIKLLLSFLTPNYQKKLLTSGRPPIRN